MFPSSITLRVTGLREEEDYLFTDQWIEAQTQQRFGSTAPLQSDYKALAQEAPRRKKIFAVYAITDASKNYFGQIEHDITDAYPGVRIGDTITYQ